MKPYRLKRKRIARRRINHLFEMAEKMALEGRLELATRYVDIARRIGMKYLVRIPWQYKRRFCKECHSYLLPGENCTVRIKKKTLIISFHVCGHVTRVPFAR